MGIFEAERRRLSKAEENRVTSTVFGTLEIVDRSRFLGAILNEIDRDIAGRLDVGGLKFSYWEKTGKKCPDVLLRNGTTFLSIECKLASSFDVDQLADEHKDRPLCLVAISSHHNEPPEIEEARRKLRGKASGSLGFTG